MSPDERAARTAQARRSRKLRELGRPMLIDARPSTAHVRALLAAGATRAGIAHLAGLSPNVIGWLADGTKAQVRRDNAARLAGITLADVVARPDDGYVPAAGTQRRIRALLVLGWPHDVLTARIRAAGPVRSRSSLLLRPAAVWVTRPTHDAVAAVYAQLADRPGPNRETARRARAAGHPGPLAWDGVDIDDPAAQPLHDARVRVGVDDRLDDLMYLLDAGEHPETAARRAGYASAKNVDSVARRAGRLDVLTALSTARSTAA